jgi:phosphorylcholine metabolism protein LicD
VTVKEEAVQALHTFQEAAALAGVRWFLNAGTLLGAVRDQDFCPGDEDDIDIGVFDEDFDRMGDVTEGAWFRVMDRFIYRERVEGVKLELQSGQVRIDVSRFRLNPRTGDRYDVGRLCIDGERIFCVNVYPVEHWRRFEVITFQGIPCNIPAHAEELLAYRYGADWRLPCHRRDWDWLKWLPHQNCVRLEYECL